MNSILRLTASEAYKRDIQPLDPARAHALMAAKPIWYHSKSPADDPDWSWYGLPTEAVAAIDSRLVICGYREDDFELVAVGAEDGGAC